MFTQAIVRPPAENFSDGLTTAGLGPPDYKLALAQHEAYCAALERCGLNLTRLDPDPDYPDSTFVEDVAIVTERLAIITRPGAPSRRGEVQGIRKVLAGCFESFSEIQAPGTVDGGDVCQAGEHFFIGVSARTDEAGAKQLAVLLRRHGYSSTIVDVLTPSPSGTLAAGTWLHLKSGVAYLGDNRLAITEAWSDQPAFAGFDLVQVNAREEYAANCVRINHHVLLAAGYPELESGLGTLGYQTIAVEMSEFQKMDGGLSCLSLRF